MDRDEHHRRSIRWKGKDYRDGGTYFVTICTKNKEPIFGEIRNGIMGLSEVGCIVADELQKTPIIRPYVELWSWIVMPNHIHVIFYIDETRRDMMVDTDNDPRRGMARHAPTDDGNERHFSKPIAGSLSSIVGSFKSAVTKRVNELRGSDDTIWQRNFHERVIRDEDERHRIIRYILDNPKNWNIDPENI